MPSSISLHSVSAIAYGFRYRAPLKHTCLLYAHQLHSSHRQKSPLFSSSFCRVLNPSFVTGNSLFSRMEQFWSGSAVNRNKGMTEQLRRYGVIKSQKVTEIMETVDRGLFVPEGTPAYVDSPMSIGYNATISAPHMHAMCLELLEDRLQPGMHALDVGSGTGYLTACFALMVGPQGRVVGVEHIPELVAWSIKNVEKSAAAPLLKEGSLSLHVGGMVFIAFSYSLFRRRITLRGGSVVWAWYFYVGGLKFETPCQQKQGVLPSGSSSSHWAHLVQVTSLMWFASYCIGAGVLPSVHAKGSRCGFPLS
ncbi:hypothetical protein AABB24_026694 [Solanum stoloniferum]|uniref:Protein-L-isoaspartate O-methyltransferase n=1 Tax=Solanum stoloniferum TaxID=62892 RepID=A0ABD2SG03_9SOLN